MVLCLLCPALEIIPFFYIHLLKHILRGKLYHSNNVYTEVDLCFHRQHNEVNDVYIYHTSKCRYRSSCLCLVLRCNTHNKVTQILYNSFNEVIEPLNTYLTNSLSCEWFNLRVKGCVNNQAKHFHNLPEHILDKILLTEP